MGTEVFPLGLKRQGREVDHLLTSSATVKIKWSYTSILFNGVNRDNYTFIFFDKHLTQVLSEMGCCNSRK
jgi:hypothetical protein